jgi:hypothetical protein
MIDGFSGKWWGVVTYCPPHLLRQGLAVVLTGGPDFISEVNCRPKLSTE